MVGNLKMTVEILRTGLKFGGKNSKMKTTQVRILVNNIRILITSFF
jgi:hypothetical protein